MTALGDGVCRCILKTELEATFKEDISIYFDQNPHDGLLETHNVDKTLEGQIEMPYFHSHHFANLLRPQKHLPGNMN